MVAANKSDPFSQDEIIFKEDTHQYFSRSGEEYTSVSKVIKQVEPFFDRQGISLRMAQSVAADYGVSAEQAQKDILDAWDGKKDSSIVKGNFVHGGLESYARRGVITPGLEKGIAYIKNVFAQYYRFYPEVILHSHAYKIAGTTDLLLQRQKSRGAPVIDVRDYKTNEAKGICFDSIKRKDGEIKYVNSYFQSPFEYLEYCNYTGYSFQMSIYAFLLMEMGFRIGSLGIIFFDNDYNPSYIPVPFMYQEARMLCELNVKETKPLPEMKNVFVYGTSGPTVADGTKPEGYEEDW